MGVKMKKENNKKPLINLKKSYSKLSIAQKMLLFIGLMFIVISTLPAVMVLLIGLLPTFTILITDPKNTDKLVIVGSFNLAGVFIYLMSVINSFTLHNAFFIVGDIFNLIIMLGSAGLGLVAYYEIPNLFILISKASAQKRLKTIDVKLAHLAEDWGSDLIDRQKE